MQYKLLGNLSACLASQMVVNLRLLKQRIRSPPVLLKISCPYKKRFCCGFFFLWWYSGILLTLSVHLVSDNNTLATFSMDQL